MAEEKDTQNPMTMVYFVGAIVVILVFLWYMSDGPSRADLRGIFLSPPEPLGTGEAHGPGGTTTPQEPQFQTGTVEPPGQVRY